MNMCNVLISLLAVRVVFWHRLLSVKDGLLFFFFLLHRGAIETFSKGANFGYIAPIL